MYLCTVVGITYIARTIMGLCQSVQLSSQFYCVLRVINNVIFWDTKMQSAAKNRSFITGR